MSENTTINWEDYTPQIDTKKVMKELSGLCKTTLQLQEEQAELEAQLKKKKEEVRRYREQLIPDLLLETGFEKITLDTGEEIVIRKIYSGNIKKENWEAAKQWLTEHGDDVMIKTQIKADFGKGRQETENSVKMMMLLRENNIPFDAKEGVHPMTLKSYIKQKMEAGEELPQNLFGVHVVTQATIKPTN